MQSDIFFVSYGETNADRHWQLLSDRFPGTRRISGVRGIANAYRAAAQQSSTDSFYIVDADNELLPGFDFKTGIPYNGSTCVWRALNPVNGLAYGYGGIKRYPKAPFLHESAMQSPLVFLSEFDFPVCGSVQFQPVIASITHFNSSEFGAWKAAFRECCKLAVMGRYMGHSAARCQESEVWLDAWTRIGGDKPFGAWVLQGALQGKTYGLQHIDELGALLRINDFEWLRGQFAKIKTHVLT